MDYLEMYSRKYRTPSGAVKEGQNLHFEIELQNADQLKLVCRSDDGEISLDREMERDGSRFFCDIVFQSKGLYYYSICDGKGCYLDYTSEGEPFLSEHPVNSQLLVISAAYVPARSYYGGIAYQIFPDRFAITGKVEKLPGRVYHDDLSEIPEWRPDSKGKIRNNDFYGGNLKGIISKLPYLSSLGVTLIYLNPIFESNSNHRYDTADYFRIDPQLGSEQDFRELCIHAKQYGIRIILDGVFSHTGDDSLYFNRYGNYPSVGAYQSMQSKYYEWYIFQKWPDRYDSWWGIDTLPEVNEMNESYVEFITGKDGVIEYWMKAGASGLRLDVADELPDEFIVKIRDAVKRNDPGSILIGEVWEDASNKISYGKRRKYFWGDELDGCMNYPFKNAVLSFIRDPDAASFAAEIESIYLHYPTEMLNSCLNMLSSHDTERAINALSAPITSSASREEKAARKLTKSEYLRGVEMLKLAYALMFFLPGIPMIYYGDEIGMQGYGDPFCRGFFLDETADENLKSAIQEICEIRRGMAEVLSDGNLSFFRIDGKILGFYRTNDKGKVAFMLNRGDTPAVFNIDSGWECVEPWTYKVVRIE